MTAKSEALIDRLAELPKGRAAKAIYDKLEELEARKEQLQEETLVLETKARRGPQVIDITKVLSMLKLIGDRFHKLSPQDQQAGLRDIVDSVELHPDHLLLSYHCGRAPLDGERARKDKPRSRALAVQGLSDFSLSGAGGARTPGLQSAILPQGVWFRAVEKR